jgi:hypothetical protein
MKFTTTALALVLTATAGSAYAQYGTPAPPTNQQPTRMEQQDQTDQNAKKPTVKPSRRAEKALIELQKAVDANDTATIAAKLAEAEKVASTKEDHYLIGNMRLKAALAAKDNAAMASTRSPPQAMSPPRRSRGCTWPREVTSTKRNNPPRRWRSTRRDWR